MLSALLLKEPLANVFFSRKKNMRYISAIVLGNLLLFIAAKIPLNDSIPITIQILVILLLSMTCGWHIAASVIALYLFELALSLPFAVGYHSGLNFLFGPMGGFYFGYFPAAILTGYLIEKGWGSHYLTIALAGMIGILTIHAYGILGMSKFIGFHSAYLKCIKSFITYDLIKILLLTFIVPFFWTPIPFENHPSY